MIFFLAVLLLVGSSSSAHAQESGLPTPEMRQAAVRCQKIVTQVTGKVATARFKALDKCANAALACVQTPGLVATCLSRAATGCQRTFASAAGAAIRARTKISGAKSCIANLRTEDLLGSDGLGFGLLAPLCDADFNIDVCQGIAPLADCLVRTHERTAGALYARARPRTAELLGLLPGDSVLPIAGLTSFPGCTDCSVAPGEGRALTKCGKLLTQAAGKLLTTLDKRFANCAQRVLGCVQARVPKPDCVTKATDACNAEAGKLQARLGDFVAKVTAGNCKSGKVAFATLVGASGLNFAGDTTACAASGGGQPQNLPELASCLATEARCDAAGVARQQVPRTAELDDAGLLGALGGSSVDACSGSAPGTPLTVAAAQRSVFSSITKIVRTIRGFTLNRNPPPRTTPGALRTVSANGSPRVGYGGLAKIPYRIRLNRPRQGAKARASLAPKLIVTALGGAPSGDYFEMDLPIPANPDDEITGVLDVTYDGQPPSCAFNLAFAISADGVVSAYTPLVQIADLAVPSSHEVRLKLSDIDDRVVASLNGHAAPTVFFGGEERVFDVTPSFQCGENVVEVQVFNDVGGYTHRAALEVDNVEVVQSRCGTFLGQGCNFNDHTTGLVYDEVTYFCVPCDGKACTGGTCSNPYVVPDHAAVDGTLILKADVSGPSHSDFCDGTGPERVFSLTPAARACYQFDSCRASDVGTSVYTSIGGCGTPNEEECIIDGCGYVDDTILAAGVTRTIVVDTLGPVDQPAGVSLDVLNIGATTCD
jgi:hypothetical protein